MFSSEMPSTLLDNCKHVLETLNASYHTSRATIAGYKKGIKAIEEIVAFLDESGELTAEIWSLRGMMRMTDEDIELEMKAECCDAITLGQILEEVDGIVNSADIGKNIKRNTLVKRAKQLMYAHSTDTMSEEYTRGAIVVLNHAYNYCSSKKQRFKVLVLRCDCYHRMKEMYAALEDASEALQLSAKQNKAQTNLLAHVATACERWDLVVKAYQTGLSHYPEDDTFLQRKEHALERLNEKREIDCAPNPWCFDNVSAWIGQYEL